MDLFHYISQRIAKLFISSIEPNSGSLAWVFPSPAIEANIYTLSSFLTNLDDRLVNPFLYDLAPSDSLPSTAAALTDRVQVTEVALFKCSGNGNGSAGIRHESVRLAVVDLQTGRTAYVFLEGHATWLEVRGCPICRPAASFNTCTTPDDIEEKACNASGTAISQSPCVPVFVHVRRSASRTPRNYKRMRHFVLNTSDSALSLKKSLLIADLVSQAEGTYDTVKAKRHWFAMRTFEVHCLLLNTPIPNIPIPSAVQDGEKTSSGDGGKTAKQIFEGFQAAWDADKQQFQKKIEASETALRERNAPREAPLDQARLEAVARVNTLESEQSRLDQARLDAVARANDLESEQSRLDQARLDAVARANALEIDLESLRARLGAQEGN